MRRSGLAHKIYLIEGCMDVLKNKHRSKEALEQEELSIMTRDRMHVTRTTSLHDTGTRLLCLTHHILQYAKESYPDIFPHDGGFPARDAGIAREPPGLFAFQELFKRCHPSRPIPEEQHVSVCHMRQ